MGGYFFIILRRFNLTTIILVFYRVGFFHDVVIARIQIGSGDRHRRFALSALLNRGGGETHKEETKDGFDPL